MLPFMINNTPSLDCAALCPLCCTMPCCTLLWNPSINSGITGRSRDTMLLRALHLLTLGVHVFTGNNLNDAPASGDAGGWQKGPSQQQEQQRHDGAAAGKMGRNTSAESK